MTPRRLLTMALLGATLVSGAMAQTTPAKPIDLKVESADVRQTLRVIFRQTGLSYTIAAEVQGVVSADFRGLALGDALSVVLRQVGAVAREEGGVIQVIPKTDDADASTLLYRSGIQGVPPIRITPAPEDPTVVVSDEGFLYVVRGATVTKVDKARMAVVARASLEPRRIRFVYGSDPTNNLLLLVRPPTNDPTFVTQDARFLYVGRRGTLTKLHKGTLKVVGTTDLAAVPRNP